MLHLTILIDVLKACNIYMCVCVCVLNVHQLCIRGVLNKYVKFSLCQVTFVSYLVEW